MEYEENDCVSGLFQTFQSVQRKWEGVERSVKLSARCLNLVDVRPESFDRRDLTKTAIANHLSSYVHQVLDHQLVFNQCKDVVNDLTGQISRLKEEISQLKSSNLSAQDSIISLQKELLSTKNEQLDLLQTSVGAAVKSSVQTEMKSYSDALTAKSVEMKSASKPTIKSIKRAVEEVVQEEDRNKNVIVFGMKEDDGEMIGEKVDELFGHLGTKPRHECVRIGVKKKDAAVKPRPIKVSMASSAHVSQILRAARSLSHSDSFKNVFVCPDRTVDERKARKEAVTVLQKRIADDPNNKHYIRGGKVVTVSAD